MMITTTKQVKHHSFMKEFFKSLIVVMGISTFLRSPPKSQNLENINFEEF